MTTLLLRRPLADHQELAARLAALRDRFDRGALEPDHPLRGTPRLDLPDQPDLARLWTRHAGALRAAAWAATGRRPLRVWRTATALWMAVRPLVHPAGWWYGLVLHAPRLVLHVAYFPTPANATLLHHEEVSHDEPRSLAPRL